MSRSVRVKAIAVRKAEAIEGEQSRRNWGERTEPDELTRSIRQSRLGSDGRDRDGRHVPGRRAGVSPARLGLWELRTTES
jgi:hypothetical protein